MIDARIEMRTRFMQAPKTRMKGGRDVRKMPSFTEAREEKTIPIFRRLPLHS
jgi:hypothetical protein